MKAVCLAMEDRLNPDSNWPVSARFVQHERRWPTFVDAYKDDEQAHDFISLMVGEWYSVTYDWSDHRLFVSGIEVLIDLEDLSTSLPLAPAFLPIQFWREWRELWNCWDLRRQLRHPVRDVAHRAWQRLAQKYFSLRPWEFRIATTEQEIQIIPSSLKYIA